MPSPSVQILLFFSFLLFVMVHESQSGVSRVCDKINRYENGLPSTLKKFSKHDAVGPSITILHQVLMAATRMLPFSEEMCKSRIIKLGKFEIKTSLRPRGCCSHCCLVRNPPEDVVLYFSNKKTAPEPVPLTLDRKKGKLKSLGFMSDAPTVIFLPGFTEHGLSLNSQLIRDAYSSRNETFNVVTVDWGDYTAVPWYFEAVDNARTLAPFFARFLRFFDKTGELPIEKLHVVGFSLGAHMAGYIGKLIRKTKKLPRITALEPANPLYDDEDVQNRISKDDADFVDVIHTDPGKFGLMISVGHADFYPNFDLPLQPGCELVNLVQSRVLESFTSCEHLRAVELFAESVKNPSAFPAVKVKAVEEASNIRRARFVPSAYMGFAARKDTTQGDFFLTTNNREPFGRPVNV